MDPEVHNKLDRSLPGVGIDVVRGAPLEVLLKAVVGPLVTIRLCV